MSKIRRVAAVAILCVVGAAYGTASPAHADTPEVFQGASKAVGLDVDALNVSATLGQATATVQSAVEAVGTGVGQLLAVTSGSLPVLTRATPANPSPAAGIEQCGLPSLGEPLNSLLDLKLACGSSSASFVNGFPNAFGSGKVLGLDLSLNTLVGPLDDTLKIGDTLAATLAPIGDALRDTPLSGTTDTVVGLVHDVLHTKTLEVTLGESTSSVKTAAGSVTSLATGSGAEIRLLPLPSALQAAGLPTDPVATISIGKASASAVFDRNTGVATPTITPSLVHIHLNSAVQLLAGLPHDIDIAPGISKTILENTPLESTISVAAGSTSQSADKRAAGAEADGVALHLLKGVNGGINLVLAHAEASVGGQLATKTPVVNAVELPRQLPRTGGPSPWVPGLAVGILIVAGATRRAVLRTR
jgi:hypothetical protein